MGKDFLFDEETRATGDIVRFSRSEIQANAKLWLSPKRPNADPAGKKITLSEK